MNLSASLNFILQNNLKLNNIKHLKPYNLSYNSLIMDVFIRRCKFIVLIQIRC